MQCPKCGVDLESEVRFCPECGAKIPEYTETPDAPAPTEGTGLKIPTFSVPPMGAIGSYGGAAPKTEAAPEEPATTPEPVAEPVTEEFIPSFRVSEPEPAPVGTIEENIPDPVVYHAPVEAPSEAKETVHVEDVPPVTLPQHDMPPPRIEMPPYAGPPPQMQQPPYGAPPPQIPPEPYGAASSKFTNAAPKKKTGLIIGISVACVLVIAAGIILAFMYFGDSSEDEGFATIEDLLGAYFEAFAADEADMIGGYFLPELVAAFESDGYSLEEIAEYLDAGYDDYGTAIKKWSQEVSQELDIDDTFLGDKNVDIDTSKVQSARYLEADVTFKSDSEVWIFEFDVAKRDGGWYLVEVR